MKIRPYQFFCMLLLFSMTIGKAHGQFSVVDSQAASQLVQKIIGKGVTVLNAVLTCPGVSSATFNITGPNDLGFDSGIVLTTGNVIKTGNNTGVFGIRPIAMPGPSFRNRGDTTEPDLKSLVGNVALHDVCKLELDFIPAGSSLSFDYVFASSEYQSFSCSGYNDVFGFFLSGPGLTGVTNLATIPDTNVPVSVNSTTDTVINRAGNTLSCTMMGAGAPFSQFYTDNRFGTTITYWGFTKILTAKATLIPCQQYHIKMAIADVSDENLDSGTFLKAGSFSSDTVIATTLYDTTFCYKDIFPPITLAATSEYPSRQWDNGDTSHLRTVRASGTYWARSGNCMVHTDTFHIQGYRYPEAFSLGADTMICAKNLTMMLQAPVAAGVSRRWQDNTDLHTMVVDHAGVYTLTLDNGHCATTDSITIGINKCSCVSIMPNAFSPNGDGLNDRITARLSPDCQPAKSYLLQIFDRWGKRVYAAFKPDEAGWDGTFRGRKCEPGTYFYELRFKGREQKTETVEKGDISLIE